MQNEARKHELLRRTCWYVERVRVERNKVMRPNCYFATAEASSKEMLRTFDNASDPIVTP